MTTTSPAPTPTTLSPARRWQTTRAARVGFALRPKSPPGQAFGAITGGGMESPVVLVHSRDELQAALDRPDKVWIVVDPGQEWHGADDIVVRRDNKTVLGNGLRLHGFGIVVDRCMNIVIESVTSLRARRDAFEVTRSRVVALVDCVAIQAKDGGFDVVRGATDVVLVRCMAIGCKKAMLIGAADQPFSEQQTGGLVHLGLMDDRLGRVWLEGCTFEEAENRAPMARHYLVVMVGHWLLGGGKRGLIEARTGARVVWLSGGVHQNQGRPIQAATDKGHSAKTGGRLYVAPGVDLGGATVQATPWQPAAAELQEWGVLSG